ncbi:MAG: hypothetical protein NZ739_00810 [Verrucomicrobiae bacterium]|nr:hypothetical protein [Verrucomicrobiae bacterium]MCX7722881.1 hypothetical protein [Verrucomicrobiae bacterium]
MAFKDFPDQEQAIALLQRSLERGRVAHAYMFSGHDIDELEAVARTLAKTFNCLKPIKRKRVRVDCCDTCAACAKVESGAHPDVHWVRPESKTRVILIEQIRELMRELSLKPAEAQYKIGVVVGADRLNVQAANAFLKTLEEPPGDAVLVLLTTDPQRVLDTVASRCIRLSFGTGSRPPDKQRVQWLAEFGASAAAAQDSLLDRYRLLSFVTSSLARLRSEIESALSEASPLARYGEYPELEPELREKWRKELEAAIEAAYRQRRAALVADLQVWFRDVWLRTLRVDPRLLSLPEECGTGILAARLSPGQALENLQVLEQLQWFLSTNVQEHLAFEVSFLKLHLG